jgi:hypothetical protein
MDSNTTLQTNTMETTTTESNSNTTPDTNTMETTTMESNSNTTPDTNTMDTIEKNYEKIGCHDAFVKISNKLEGRTIPQSFRSGLESLRNAGNKYQVYKYSMSAPDNADILKQVIGRNGCYFIRTTQECDLDFIWHNRDNNTIEFWGPKYSIDKAVGVIESRISKIRKTSVVESMTDDSVES